MIQDILATTQPFPNTEWEIQSPDSLGFDNDLIARIIDTLKE
jgi:hypothetical protein